MVAINSHIGLHPDEIARRSFPSARRGLDQDAVRQYLEAVAAEMRQVLDREQALRRQLAEAERRAAEPELDEQTLLRAVGAETARILQTAHDAANDVNAKAVARAAEILAEAEGILAERTAVADAEVARILEGAIAEAAALTEAAREEAVALLDATRAECRRVVRDARHLRASILNDLAERRRTLRVQLEELRTGRDSLLEVVDAVGGSVEQLRERIANAEHEARLAAADAGERAAAEDDSDLPLADAFGEGVLDEAVLTEAAEDEETGVGVSPELYDEQGDEPDRADHEEETGVGVTSHRSVDELFARIRAGRKQSDTEPPAGPLDSGTIEGTAATELGTAAAAAELLIDELVAELPAAGEELQIAVLEEVVAEDLAEEAVLEGVLGSHSAHEAAVEEVGAEDPEEDVALRARRSELLGPVTTKLSRALKRALQDDQNQLLDAFRHASGAPDLDRLLPEEPQRARLAEATAGWLADAWRLGYSWLDDQEAKPDDVTAAGQRVASELAVDVTGLLRHRLTEALSSLGDLSEGAAEAAGASYREWRGSRVERAAADFATRAFSDGAIAGGTGKPVRWVVDDEGQPCPDCDDNALAGTVTAGEEFPTGQVHPPVHPGCRCLLVAISS